MKKLFEKYREIIVYIIVGLMTTVVAYGIRMAVLYPLAAAFSLDLDVTGGEMLAKVSTLRTVATSCGWVAGVIFAFFTNKFWVFRNEEKGKRAVWLQFGKFVASRLATYFVELGIGVLVPLALTACGYVAFRFIINIDADIVAMAISMVVVTVLNYILSKLLVFRKNKKAAGGDTAGN